MAPAVTVLIPVYNGVNYLRQAIDSVLAQTFTDYELLVVDDGSTDDTWSVIQSYGAKLRALRKENGGVASALNLGLQQARGEWIAWLSHDDAFLPEKLAVHLEYLARNPQFRASYSDYWVMDGEGKRQGVLHMPSYPPERFVRHLFQCCFVHGCASLIHRDCFAAVGPFPEDARFRYTQDADMWLRIARRFPFLHIPEPLTLWRYHAGQDSRNLKQTFAGARAYLERCLETFALEDFFPELAQAPRARRARARARTYLGRVMLVRHKEPVPAARQYALALREWPSPRNPALPRLASLLLGEWAFYYYGRRAAAFVRSRRAAAIKSPPDFFRAASRAIDFEVV